MLRRLAAVLFVALLAGCVSPYPDAISPESDNVPLSLPPPANDGIVVIGMRVEHPQRNPFGGPWAVFGGWVTIDPATDMRAGKTMTYFRFLGGALASDAVRGRTQYLTYTLPAGTYALAWVEHGPMLYEPTLFQSIVTRSSEYSFSRQFSDLAKAPPNTPVFVVKPGDVVYVGDLTFDFGTPLSVHWSTSVTEAEARAGVAREGIGDRMTLRPMRRADGKEIEPTDGTTIGSRWRR